MNRTLLLISAIWLSGMAMVAESRTLSPQEALARATSQLSTQGGGQMSPASVVSAGTPTLCRTFTEGALPTVYVFNQSAGRGTLFVAATDAVPKAVLGYTTEGSYDAAGNNPGLRWWIETMSREIATAAEDDAVAATDSVDNRADIAPILTTTWGQLSPFNDWTPVVNGAHTPSGCVATALAQCMKMARWPEHGRGQMSYDWWDSGSIETLSMDFDTVSYNWDNLIDYYGITEGGTVAERHEAAKLLYSVGISVKMQYNPAGSGSGYMEGATALIKYFDYAESVCYFERDYFKFEEWKSIIYDELQKGRPVPYSGQADSGGHAFVCDGYQTGGYFHFNWGWYGSDNGYYLLTALNPADADLTVDEGYNRGQAIVTGLVPASEAVEPEVALRISGDFQTEYEKYYRYDGGTLIFGGEYGIYSRSYAQANVELGIKLTDTSGNTQYVGSDTVVTFYQFTPQMEYSVPMSNLPASGAYVVTPAFCDSVGVWHDIRVKISNVGSLYMVVSSKSVVFSESPELPDLEFSDMELEGPLFVGKEFGLRATLTNEGTEFFDDLYVALVSTGDTTFVAIGPQLEVDVPKGDVQTAEWVGKLRATSGNTLNIGGYRMGLVRVDGGQYVLVSPLIDVELRNASSATLMFTADNILLNGEFTTPENPAEITDDNTAVSFDLACTQGYFGEVIVLRVFLMDNMLVQLETSARFVGLEGGKSETLTFPADFSRLEPNTLYRVMLYGQTSGLLNTDNAGFFKVVTTGVECPEADSFKVYPNPATTTATVSSAEPISGIEVYNMSGGRCSVATDIDGSEGRIDVSPLASGIYFVRIETAGGAVVSKLIKR